MVEGLILAVLAAVLSGAGSVMESLGTRRAAGTGAADDAPPPMRSIARQPLYWIGITVDLIGFVAAAAAMQFLPLFLVQACVAGSVGITAILSRMWLGTRLSRWGRSSLVIMLAGLIGLAVAARPGPIPELDPAWTWIPLLWAVPTGLLAAVGFRIDRQRTSAAVLALAAGSGYSAVAVAARSLDIPREGWSALLDPNLAAVVVNGILGTMVFAAALQRGSVTVVSAINYVTETVLPSIVGLVWFGEGVRTDMESIAIAGFILAVGGAIAVAGVHRPGAPDGPAPPAARDGERSLLQVWALRRWHLHRGGRAAES